MTIGINRRERNAGKAFKNVTVLLVEPDNRCPHENIRKEMFIFTCKPPNSDPGICTEE